MKDPFGDELKSDEFENENESKEAHAKAAARRNKVQKFEADTPGAYLQSFTEWRDLRQQWKETSEEERFDLLYGIAFLNGGKIKQVAAAFAIKVEDLKPYKEIFEQARAVLSLKIQGHQIRWGLTTNHPNAKFFLGKQFAQQVENPAHEEVDSLDDQRGAPKVTLHVRQRPEAPALEVIDLHGNSEGGDQ